jgi:hypothetical protein
MTKLRILWLFAIILQLPLYSFGQFSRKQAEALVLNQILVSDTGHINVYMCNDSLSGPKSLPLLDNKKISLPYAYNWVFLSDDNPLAYWCHPCRYVIVSSSNGNYTIIDNDIYPVDLQTEYEPILLIANHPQAQPCSFTKPTYAISNPHLHAVLICGGDACNFNNDIAVIYNTLKEAGYPKTNITVLYGYGYSNYNTWRDQFDGDGMNEINDSATTNWVDTTFRSLNILGPEDQLFVFVDDHGDTINGESYFILPSQGGSGTTRYFSSQLVSAVRNIPCAQMVFVMQQCHSGGFIHPLLNDISNSLCKNRLILTSVDSSQDAWGENHITSNNFGEFTYYFSAAARGYYPGDVPWKWGCKVGTFPFDSIKTWGSKGHPADYNPDNGNPSAYDVGRPPQDYVLAGNSDNFTQLIEAFNYANCMNSWSEDGYYNPSTTPSGGNSGENNPQFGIKTGFDVDDLYCLNGIAGNTSINAPQTLDGRGYLLGGNLNIRSNMTINQNAELTMGVDNTLIDANQNSTVSISSGVIFNGMSTTIQPYSSKTQITI